MTRISCNTSITIRKPDDWHLHLREGSILEAALPYTVRQFSRAIIMPNLAIPITTIEGAIKYREKILKAVPKSEGYVHA